MNNVFIDLTVVFCLEDEVGGSGYWNECPFGSAFRRPKLLNFKYFEMNGDVGTLQLWFFA